MTNKHEAAEVEALQIIGEIHKLLQGKHPAVCLAALSSVTGEVIIECTGDIRLAANAIITAGDILAEAVLHHYGLAVVEVGSPADQLLKATVAGNA